ncbi:hypothetical protein M8R50_16790 [Enterobacter bugandensis]|uniref:hypothetical protein n=1 Tax=Enterobacter bugandensis TaxID=881260 RepID=UPI002075F1E2|nr:hypothetical protein [Enterobacter bugandensis]MCM7239196.1 hypothetical protein [Enterobacter bugandensis]MCM7319106.1 hypothetical protein [Enterobacter bugandensis]MCM7354567.1 hypothetical protein [Enterobacter bugandensis]
MKSATVSALTRKSAGVYTVTVTVGTDNEIKITPLASGVTLSSSDVTISSRAPEQGLSTIARDKAAYISRDDITLTVTLKDAKGNGVKGLVVGEFEYIFDSLDGFPTTGFLKQILECGWGLIQTQAEYLLQKTG